MMLITLLTRTLILGSHNTPRAVSWGAAKIDLIARPAGSTLNRVEALKVVRPNWKQK